jgi:hypothetical protein
MLEAVAEDFGKIPLSQMLAATVARGMDYARAQNHRTMTLEHLLLALTEDEEAALVLMGCNVDLIRLRDDIAGYLGQLNDRAPPDAAAKPIIAPELKRIIEYAAAAAQQAKRSNVNGAITLAAMIGEGRSMAASFLRAQGLTFEVAVRVLQQQGKPQTPPAGGPAASAEDILSGARARIAASRGQGGARPQTAPNPMPRGMGPQADPRPPQRDPAPDQRAERPSLDTRPSLDDGAEAVAHGGTAPATDRAEKNLGDGAAAENTRESGRAPPPLPHTRPDSGVLGPQAKNDEDNPTRPPLPHWMQTGAQGREQPQRPRGIGSGGGDVLGQPPVRADRPIDAGPAGGRPPVSVQRDGARPAPGAPARTIEPARVHRRPSVEPGQLVENVPRRMRVGTMESVEVRIARDDMPGVSSGLQGQAPPVRHDLLITKAMSVRLRAPDGGFVIESASPETQWTEPSLTPLSSDFASWRFLITPQRRGEATLQLVVAARAVGRDGIVAETALPDRVINVRVRTNYVRAGLRGAVWLAALAIGGVVGKLGENTVAVVTQLVRSGFSP